MILSSYWLQQKGRRLGTVSFRVKLKCDNTYFFCTPYLYGKIKFNYGIFELGGLIRHRLHLVVQNLTCLGIVSDSAWQTCSQIQPQRTSICTQRFSSLVRFRSFRSTIVVIFSVGTDPRKAPQINFWNFDSRSWLLLRSLPLRLVVVALRVVFWVYGCVLENTSTCWYTWTSHNLSFLLFLRIFLRSDIWMDNLPFSMLLKFYQLERNLYVVESRFYTRSNSNFI